MPGLGSLVVGEKAEVVAEVALGDADCPSRGGGQAGWVEAIGSGLLARSKMVKGEIKVV